MISWCILTFNRADTVAKAITQNFTSKGSFVDEIVWHDNGSKPEEKKLLEAFMGSLQEALPVTKIMAPKNLGVHVGYNRTFSTSRGDWILVTGCDRLMPKDWLLKMLQVLDADTSIHVVSLYTKHISKVPERLRGPEVSLGGHQVVEAMPFGARIFSRELLHAVGYLREDFGLYGPSDIEWAERAMRHCDRAGWKYVAMADEIADHLGDEGINPHSGADSKEYHEFKQREISDPSKLEKLEWCLKKNYPYYNPYSGEI